MNSSLIHLVAKKNNNHKSCKEAKVLKARVRVRVTVIFLHKLAGFVRFGTVILE